VFAAVVVVVVVAVVVVVVFVNCSAIQKAVPVTHQVN
jgi:hypothetical protein